MTIPKNNDKEGWAQYAIDHMSPTYFWGNTFINNPDGAGRVPLQREHVARLMYTHSLGVSKGTVDNVFDAVKSSARDISDTRHFVGMGDTGTVFNTRTLAFEENQLDYMYSTRYTPSQCDKTDAYLLSLANGDPDLAEDYVQALAPLLLDRKPSGVVWFVGDGANGKSGLLDAVYRLFGPYFRSVNVRALEDGRMVPSLRGAMGNICRESSDGRIEDTDVYKAIGTHESFPVRLMRSNDIVDVDGNFHTVFNANNIPIFADKTSGARRRTLVVPFPAHFKDNPSFAEKTFTDDFLGGLLWRMIESAKRIKANGYRYSWSETTLAAKADYDSGVNSAEAYLEHLRDNKFIGFANYRFLQTDYENWCANHGHNSMGRTVLSRVFRNNAQVRQITVREDGMVFARYYIDGLEREKDDVLIDTNMLLMRASKERKQLSLKEQKEW